MKASGSLNPMPPLRFEAHIFCQEIQCTFRSPFLAPHQNLEEIEVKFRHIFFVRWKQLMVNVGDACRPDFISTSLAFMDKPCPFHPVTLPFEQCVTYLKVRSFERPTSVGRPSYVSDKASVNISNVAHTLPLSFTLVLGLKKILDFGVLTRWPELSQYVSRIFFSVAAF